MNAADSGTVSLNNLSATIGALTGSARTSPSAAARLPSATTTPTPPTAAH
jgi:hypothetical protein